MYLVCRYKNSNELFIQTRKDREVELSVLLDIGDYPKSIVEKEFKTIEQAKKYIDDTNESNNSIDDILKN